MVGWHLKYYFLGRGTPVSAGVYIIDVCNYKCLMCDIRMKDNPVTKKTSDSRQYFLAAICT